MTLTVLNFVIALAAGWRLASLFANERGAFYIFARLRDWVSNHEAEHPEGFLARLHFAEGLECEWCNSVWFGGILTALWLIFGDNVIRYVCLPLALSTGAIILKYVVQTLNAAKEYFERLNRGSADRERFRAFEELIEARVNGRVE